MDIIKSFYKDKKILVTGGTGSIGSEIVRRLLQCEPKVIRILSNDEEALFNFQQELREIQNVRYLVGDIRDKERLKTAMDGIDIVFHAAALKHVPLCEYNPFEAVHTNVLGAQNVAEAALTKNVSKCILISTDKAVSPLNVMGATKLLAERLFLTSNYHKGERKTIFSVIRFGNILNSSGSVIPLVKEQIVKGGPVTVTHPSMTRFVLTIPITIELTLKAAAKSTGGEIFVFKMPSIKLSDLVDVMIEELGSIYGHDPKEIKKTIVGPRAREKFHEILISPDEMDFLYEDEEMYIILPVLEHPTGVYVPRTRKLKKTNGSGKSYSSDNVKLLSKKEIKELLRSIEIF